MNDLPLDEKIQMMMPVERREHERETVEDCVWHNAVKSYEGKVSDPLHRCIILCDGMNLDCNGYITISLIEEEHDKLKIPKYKHMDGLA